MNHSRFMPVFAIATLAIGLLGISWFAQPVQAQDSGWSIDFLPATKTACTGAACPVFAAQNGAEILVVFESSANDVLVLHKASDEAAWTQKSANALAGPAPAVIGYVGGLEYFSGTDTWTMVMVNTGATSNYISAYSSTDDGATWTSSLSISLGGNAINFAADNAGGALQCLYGFTQAQLGCAAPRPVPDGGASGSVTISDNRGDPSVAASANTAVSAAALGAGALLGDDPVFAGTENNGVYALNCAGSFCEVPFGTKAAGPQDGSTTVLREYPCFADDSIAAPTNNLLAAAGGLDEGGVAYVSNADLDKVCVGVPSHASAVGSVIVNPTAATGAFAKVEGTDWHYAGAAATQGLTAAWDDTANKNYVFYGTTLTLEVSADTKSIAVSCGTAKCYVIYRDGTFGGAMRVAEATDFPIIEQAAENGPIFCSANGNIDFGYEYREGVTAPDQNTYKFEGDASNFDYLGKSWSPGSGHVASYFAIQANAEGIDSVFRSSFGVLGTTPSATTKGDGKDTEHFAEHIEVRFLETGNDWNVRVFHVSDSNGVGDRTALGTAFVGGQPNNMEFYNFTVDTSELRAYVTRTTLVGSNAGQVTSLFPAGVQLPAYWADDTFQNHWFVGYATDTAFNNNADTFLDSGTDGDAPLSTCIYNFDGAVATVPNGDAGRSPPDSDGDGIDDITDPDDDNDGDPDVTDPDDDNDGILDGEDPTPSGGGSGDGDDPADAGADRSFLGNSEEDVEAAIDGISGVGSVLTDIVLGLVPLWIILIAVLVGVAVLVMRLRSG